MKILNLYANIGGNRKFWDGHEITAAHERACSKIENILDGLLKGEYTYAKNAYEKYTQ